MKPNNNPRYRREVHTESKVDYMTIYNQQHGKPTHTVDILYSTPPVNICLLFINHV